jgi:hypothetical protein
MYWFVWFQWDAFRAALDKGPMESSILIGQELDIGPKAFSQGSRTKTSQIVI